ncbi:uncharacterized protein LOC126298290 [Schistocerca gregaria]|uniref:uncharacterized protein LOC126298290 n=1 Tax=Schistocerca gregaria TaxID=7010 RepID=UPI00211F1894|nr:uncharacterized protein LOC126298290 [Schistocerca gregaria]
MSPIIAGRERGKRSGHGAAGAHTRRTPAAQHADADADADATPAPTDAVPTRGRGSGATNERKLAAVDQRLSEAAGDTSRLTSKHSSFSASAARWISERSAKV